MPTKDAVLEAKGSLLLQNGLVSVTIMRRHLDEDVPLQTPTTAGPSRGYAMSTAVCAGGRGYRPIHPHVVVVLSLVCRCCLGFEQQNKWYNMRGRKPRVDAA